MKKLSLILLLLIVAKLHAQNTDGNNAPIIPNHLTTTPLREAAIVHSESFTQVYYDSVRMLTELNDTLQADAYPWLSPDGLRLYYTNGNGGNHIMFSERLSTSDAFSCSVQFPVSTGTATSIWLSNDELDAYVSSGSTVYYSHRATLGSSFGTFSSITLNGTVGSFIGNVSLDSTQNELYMYCTGAGLNQTIYTRTSPTSFTFSRNLTMPAGYFPTTGQMSKDNLKYYISAFQSGARNKLYELSRPSIADTFDVSTFQPVDGIDDTVYYQYQPTVNRDGIILVFVGAITNSWTADELFMATGTLTNAVPAVKENLPLRIWPNPTTGIISLSIVNNPNLLIEIFNSIGQCVYSKHHSTISGNMEIDLSNLPNGIYVCVADNGNTKSFSKVFLTK